MKHETLALVALSIILLILPLTAAKPGFPPTLKADEPAYLLAALSLVHDFDLRLEQKDLDRAYADYPHSGIQNLIVMSPDGWHTLFYGKPFLYPLCGAPFVALFGSNGLVFFNMLMLVLMIWMGADLLQRFNPLGLSILFSCGFFLVSTALVYVYWLHPEIFNMMATMACLYFGLPPERPAEGGWQRPVWLERLLASNWSLVIAMIALTAGAYNKPILAAVGLPVLFRYLLRLDWRKIGVLALAGACASLIFVGFSIATTGNATAYLVGLRGGFNIDDPREKIVEEIAVSVDLKEALKEERGWFWLLRIPKVPIFELAENLRYFFVGRHTGLFIFQPFSILCLLFFLLAGARSLERWLVLTGAAIVALFFLIFISFNWHGGGGFVGNRYFVMAYPALLFLVTRIRPAWALVPIFGFGGLMIGPLLIAPHGLVVPSPTLQSLVRHVPFQHFPLELSLNEIPGGSTAVMGDAYLRGRKDQARYTGDMFWLVGGRSSRLLIQTDGKIQELIFWVRSPVEGNRVLFELGGERFERILGKNWEILTFRPQAADRIRPTRHPADFEKFFPAHLYELEVFAEKGEMPQWRGLPEPLFFEGVDLRLLGTSMATAQANIPLWQEADRIREAKEKKLLADLAEAAMTK